jgi:hypothetical protein
MTRKSVRLQRRNRRGRPRDGTAVRTASGRKSRARQPKEDPRAVALAARSRVFGLPAELAGHEKAATVLGRLWLSGQITGALREAGERYIEIHAEAMRALTAPMGLTVSSKTGSVVDQVSEEYVVWATKAVARYRVVKAALEAAGVHRIVHAVAVEDAPVLPARRPELIKGLKILEKQQFGAAQYGFAVAPR